MAAKPDRSLHWLGKYLSLALVLPSSLVAGYLLGAFADHYFHRPILRAAGILLGMIAGLLQIFKEILRDEKRQ
jgi:F0F1-type ATP synthase assembly protein I